MPRQITLTEDTSAELARLACALGVPQEAALFYALRLVNACMDEGLLTDVGNALGEKLPAQRMCSTGTQGKVLDFYGIRQNT